MYSLRQPQSNVHTSPRQPGERQGDSQRLSQLRRPVATQIWSKASFSLLGLGEINCGTDVLLALLRTFIPFLLETKTLLECVYTIGSVHSKFRMGHGLGQRKPEKINRFKKCSRAKKNRANHVDLHGCGGDYRTRICDLLRVKQALYRLS